MPKDIVRHVVVTVDNLPRKKTAVQLWPSSPLARAQRRTGRRADAQPGQRRAL